MSDLPEESVVLSTGAAESLLLKQDEQFDTFEKLGLSPEVLRAVSDLGYETPTPIQLQAIPVILDGEDMFG